MTGFVQAPPYILEPDEKAAQVMMYTAYAVCWGEVIVKEVIRVSTWLRTNAAPERVCLYNAKLVTTDASGLSQPSPFREVHIATSQILAYHLVPPARDPLDYDPHEPNRRMQPVSLLVGAFRIEGSLRVATRTSLARYLEVSHERFSAIYEATISTPLAPSFRPIQVPYVLVRPAQVIFALA